MFNLLKSYNSSSSGISSNSQKSKNKRSKKGRVHDFSYNDGSYLAIENNMKLRSSRNSQNKRYLSDNNKSNENVVTKLYNKFQYCSADDSAIHHEMRFETNVKFDSVFKTEV